MLPFYHRPVMLDEVIAGLAVKPHGVYFDGTVGGGGHSFAILESDPTVRLIGTDRDEEAVKAAGERLKPFEGRFQLYKSDYRRYSEILRRAGADRLDGVLLDLGISSHQIDDEERGFSYRKASAPLDMRMDRQSGFTAEDVVNDYAEEKLFRILRDYGEERFAGAIASNIVRRREKKRITTCGELAEIVEESIPLKFRSPACARQTFQAVRIEVNGELTGLRECIKGLVRHLNVGGRICILTFHSLEDRIVKETFRELLSPCTCPPQFPVCVCGKKKELELVNKKPVTASAEEMQENSRSKCAKLRIACKIEA